MERLRFQGVRNVVSFNWHWYVIALLATIAFFVSAIYFGQPSLYIVGLAIALSAFISIVVSYYVYDRSGLYTFDWIDDKFAHAKIVLNIHAGFDETTEGLIARLPDSNIRAFDFYEPGKHTEPSIRRAQHATRSRVESTKIRTSELPVADSSADAIFVIFAAHEIRDSDERVIFFRELSRAVGESGVIAVTEHLRNAANFIAYNVGAFHFLPRSTWLSTFNGAGLCVTSEIEITPFVTTFVLKNNGTAS